MSDWLPSNFKICTSSKEYITGIVSSVEELRHLTLLESHKRASGTSYTVWSDDSNKKQKVTPQCLWRVEDYSEHVPLSVKRRVIYACQHGKNYKKTPTTDDLHTEHEYTRRKRFHIQNSKKVDCPAKLYVRYVVRQFLNRWMEMTVVFLPVNMQTSFLKESHSLSDSVTFHCSGKWWFGRLYMRRSCKPWINQFFKYLHVMFFLCKLNWVWNYG